MSSLIYAIVLFLQLCSPHMRAQQSPTSITFLVSQSDTPSVALGGSPRTKGPTISIAPSVRPFADTGAAPLERVVLLGPHTPCLRTGQPMDRHAVAKIATEIVFTPSLKDKVQLRAWISGH